MIGESDILLAMKELNLVRYYKLLLDFRGVGISSNVKCPNFAWPNFFIKALLVRILIVRGLTLIVYGRILMFIACGLTLN